MKLPAYLPEFVIFLGVVIVESGLNRGALIDASK